MSQTHEALIGALDQAMAAEEQASRFYREAVSKVQSARGKNLLSQLADFEARHLEKLALLRETLIREGNFIHYEGTRFKHYRALASEVTRKIEVHRDELLEILSVAIESESAAAERYQDLARQASDAAGQLMFQRLAEEEILHRRILSDEFYQMNIRGQQWFWGD